MPMFCIFNMWFALHSGCMDETGIYTRRVRGSRSSKIVTYLQVIFYDIFRQGVSPSGQHDMPDSPSTLLKSSF